jgi:F1F0 ATPase subunit 2
MIENIYLNAAVFFWGVVLGLLYFGGLWLTVRRLSVVNHQALWMISSFFIRNLVVVAGFYPVVLQGWRPTLICLVGFILIRFVLTQRIKVQPS